MNFLFRRFYKYYSKGTMDSIREDFSKITDTPWYDFRNNITGSLDIDNSFRITHKWTMGYIKGGGSFVYMTGEIKTENNQTIIETTVKPNIVIVFFLYFMVGLFLCELFGIKTMLEGPRFLMILTLALFSLILLGLINVMGNGLRNRFERLLKLESLNNIS